MQIRPGYVRESPQPTASPEAAIPGAVSTPEACFRDFDGYIHCVFRDSIWAQQYRAKGYPEVPQNAPDFIPQDVVAGAGQGSPPVVSSDPEEGVSEDAAPVAIEWGEVFQGGIDLINAWGRTTSDMAAPVQFASGTGPATVGPVAMNGSCGCNSNPCVCGTINGRPALVDPRTGKRCYRRRRRVMLTEGDFNTLLRIATLPNNANVRTALAKAIGRR